MFTKWFRIRSSTASTLYLYSSRHSIRHLETKGETPWSESRRTLQKTLNPGVLQTTFQTQRSPGDLLVAPLRSVGAAILQGFEDQEVTLPVAQQQVSIGPACSVQKTFYSLVRGGERMKQTQQAGGP